MSSRKRRLLACAGCMALPGVRANSGLPRSVAAAEADADGAATDYPYDSAEPDLIDFARDGRYGTDPPLEREQRDVLLAPLADREYARWVDDIKDLGWVAAVPGAERLLREVVGLPFRVTAFDPAWRTETAVALARGVYAEKAFDRMPILADALQDAGCDDEDVLAHCRDPRQEHVRGCWVLDHVLGMG